MGRRATKARENVWYQARIEASEWNERLSSREGAAEALHMSVDAVTDAELGLSKVMPVDKAVLMADLYNKPSLLNYYCLHECPIGRGLPISDEVPDIDRVTIELVNNLRADRIDRLVKCLLDIAQDGNVNDDELRDVREVVDYLRRISVLTSKLENLCKEEERGQG